MVKKVVLAVFGSIAIAGLIVAIVGFAMGGLPATLTVADGQLVYYTYRDSAALGDAPGWMRNWNGWHIGWNSRGNGWGAIIRDDSDDYAAFPVNSGPASTVTPPANRQITKVDIDIGAGYVKIVQGDEFRLDVRGPMPYTESYEDDGTWKIKARHDSIRSVWNNLGRYLFMLGDEDVTTTFTFTLPAGLHEFELDLGMGEAVIEQLDARELDCSTDMGSVIAKNVRAEEADFDVDMGGIEITGFSGGECSLTANMGHISFEGNVSRELEADCSMGGIEAVLPRPQTYAWKADVSLGTITIDGDERGGLHSSGQSGDRNTTPYFDLKCGMGSIDIRFS